MLKQVKKQKNKGLYKLYRIFYTTNSKIFFPKPQLTNYVEGIPCFYMFLWGPTAKQKYSIKTPRIKDCRLPIKIIAPLNISGWPFSYSFLFILAIIVFVSNYELLSFGFPLFYLLVIHYFCLQWLLFLSNLYRNRMIF